MDLVELLNELKYPRNARPPQTVDTLFAARGAHENACVQQSRKMLRSDRLLQARGLGYLADRRRGMGQVLQDSQPGGVGQRPKHPCTKIPLFGCHQSVSIPTVYRNITIV